MCSDDPSCSTGVDGHLTCSTCSYPGVKNGWTSGGNQRYLCRRCGSSKVCNPAPNGFGCKFNEQMGEYLPKTPSALCRGLFTLVKKTEVNKLAEGEPNVEVLKGGACQTSSFRKMRNYIITLTIFFTLCFASSCKVLKEHSNICATGMIRISDYNRLLAEDSHDKTKILETVDLFKYYDTSDTLVAFNKWFAYAKNRSSFNTDKTTAQVSYINYNVECKVKRDQVSIALIAKDSCHSNSFDFELKNNQIRIVKFKGAYLCEDEIMREIFNSFEGN